MIWRWQSSVNSVVNAHYVSKSVLAIRLMKSLLQARFPDMVITEPPLARRDAYQFSI